MNCLLARRLVERGVRFVQLYHTDWDHHGNKGTELGESLDKICRETDQGGRGARARTSSSAACLNDTLVDLGRRVRPHAAGRAARHDRPRPSHRVLHDVAGRRRREAGPVARHRPTSSATTASKTWSTSTTCTPRSCTCLGLDHLKLTFRFQGRDFRLTDVAGNVVQKMLA